MLHRTAPHKRERSPHEAHDRVLALLGEADVAAGCCIRGLLPGIAKSDEDIRVLLRGGWPPDDDPIGLALVAKHAGAVDEIVAVVRCAVLGPGRPPLCCREAAA